MRRVNELEELVFVGGCVTGLLITDEAAGAPRSTLDVDAIAEITSYAGYTSFGERLRQLGFEPDTREGAPLCLTDSQPPRPRPVTLSFCTPSYPGCSCASRTSSP